VTNRTWRGLNRGAVDRQALLLLGVIADPKRSYPKASPGQVVFE
jgi:hypothetical protein